jgi:hypothetical protein
MRHGRFDGRLRGTRKSENCYASVLSQLIHSLHYCRRTSHVKVSCSEVVITDDFESSILGSNPSRRASEPFSFVSFLPGIRLSIPFSHLALEGRQGETDKRHEERQNSLFLRPGRRVADRYWTGPRSFLTSGRSTSTSIICTEKQGRKSSVRLPRFRMNESRSDHSREGRQEYEPCLGWHPSGNSRTMAK